MKRGVLTVLVGFVLGLSGVAAASVTSSGTLTPASTKGSVHEHASPEPVETEAPEHETDTGVPGGSVARFHEAGHCGLTDVSSLQGNWTHGDYVNAVAQGGDPSQIREAAQSDCGKPTVAVGHGHGPPDHALAHMNAGQAHAGGGSSAHAGRSKHSHD